MQYLVPESAYKGRLHLFGLHYFVVRYKSNCVVLLININQCDKDNKITET